VKITEIFKKLSFVAFEISTMEVPVRDTPYCLYWNDIFLVKLVLFKANKYWKAQPKFNKMFAILIAQFEFKANRGQYQRKK